MIIYYSHSGNTKIYADSLSAQLRSRTFRLEDEKPFNFFQLGSLLIKSVFKKSSKVKAMPTLGKDSTFYVCSPIWAGGIVPAVRYFLQNAQLKGKKVNFIITCRMLETGNLKSKLEKQLKSDNYVLGDIHIFVCPAKTEPDVATIKSHLKEMVK